MHNAYTTAGVKLSGQVMSSMEDIWNRWNDLDDEDKGYAMGIFLHKLKTHNPKTYHKLAKILRD